MKRLCAIELQAGSWIQAFTLEQNSRVQLYVVNHSISTAAVSVALITPNNEVQPADIIISNALIEANSYRIFKDLEIPQLFALAVATENENLTITAVGVTVP